MPDPDSMVSPSPGSGAKEKVPPPSTGIGAGLETSQQKSSKVNSSVPFPPYASDGFLGVT